MGPFELITDGSELPGVAFAVKKDVPNYTAFDVSRTMRERGWLDPGVPVPGQPRGPRRAAIVVKNGFTMDLAGFLLDDLRNSIEYLGRLTARCPPSPAKVSITERKSP